MLSGEREREIKNGKMSNKKINDIIKYITGTQLYVDIGRAISAYYGLQYYDTDGVIVVDGYASNLSVEDRSNPVGAVAKACKSAPTDNDVIAALTGATWTYAQHVDKDVYMYSAVQALRMYNRDVGADYIWTVYTLLHTLSCDNYSSWLASVLAEAEKAYIDAERMIKMDNIHWKSQICEEAINAVEDEFLAYVNNVLGCNASTLQEIVIWVNNPDNNTADNKHTLWEVILRAPEEIGLRLCLALGSPLYIPRFDDVFNI